MNYEDEMKAIKDCRWRVEVTELTTGRGLTYTWLAMSNDSMVRYLAMEITKDLYTEYQCKKHWEYFAKLNNIPNWKFA